MNKQITFLFLAAILIEPAGVLGQTTAPGALVSQPDPIALTDQTKSGPHILLMDYTQADWGANNPKALLWSWKPSDSGISSSGWGLPTEAKLRNNSLWGGQWMAVSDSDGMMAVVSYPGKVRKWSINAGTSSNVHGIELLPSGNVAGAASNGGWVRVYAASQGASSEVFAQYDLPDAHNVLWDPSRNVLWALGGNKLVQLRVGGTDAAPALSVVATSLLPSGSGHDLQPVYGDINSLYISMGHVVYVYNKQTGTATVLQNTVGIKSISKQAATGQLIETRPHSSCTQDTWCTDVVEFSSPHDVRTRPGAAIYRARVWNANYQ
jgi:hypothetical protein